VTISRAIDKLLADQERRHAWLFEAAEQIRRDTPSTRSSEGGNTPLMKR
jgi:hypothetical protein